MNSRDVARFWESNAGSWTALSRQGYDVYRDAVNTPAFLALLPDVAGLRGLDIGCGEGHNTRLLAARGAQMTAVDIAPSFVRYAVDAGSGVAYAVADANRLPFPPMCFDFATAIMSLMDMPDPAAALREARRILCPGGFLQFSITHPCFFPPHRRQLRDEDGRPRAVELSRYFDRVDGEIDRWIFSAAPAEARIGHKPFEIPRFHRTLSEWLNAVVDAGFAIERMAEPRADEDTARRIPRVADTRNVAYFLHIRCRNPRT